ncbi:MAG TPA: hypothetical protein VEL76_43255 [Gemmataceae bacterium]|nr:hypothetical protein [Gemmataceae bacterium]
MQPWARIRHEQPDLTDFVIHLTKPKWDGRPVMAREVLLEILRSGHIRPTFAPMGNRRTRTPRNTIKGPDPAVCLTEQPIWALLTSRRILPDRYSGYGIVGKLVSLLFSSPIAR